MWALPVQCSACIYLMQSRGVYTVQKVTKDLRVFWKKSLLNTCVVVALSSFPTDLELLFACLSLYGSSLPVWWMSFLLNMWSLRPCVQFHRPLKPNVWTIWKQYSVCVIWNILSVVLWPAQQVWCLLCIDSFTCCPRSGTCYTYICFISYENSETITK